MNSRVKAFWNRGQSALASILSIFIFIIVVAIALWGAVNAVKFAPRLYEIISSPFRSKEAITITAPTTTVENNAAFSITWEHTTEAAGQYAFRFDCVEQVAVEAPIASGGVYGEITCNIPYGIPATERAIRLIPRNDNIATATVPFTLSYTDIDGETIAEVQGSFTVDAGDGAMVPEEETTPPVIEVPRETTPTTATTPRPTGPADLAITFLSLEVISAYNGYYAPQGYYNTGDIVEIRFDIQNRGHRATGPWMFNANLPAGNGYSYTSPVQRSLNPGDGSIYTLTFTMPRAGTLSIDVDPYNEVPESSEYNNTLIQALQAYEYGYSY